MAIGIEMVGGGENKLSDISIDLKDKNSKGIVMQDTSNNEVSDVRIVIENFSEHLYEMLNTISHLEDNTINPKSSKSFKSDIVNIIPKISNASTRTEIQSTSLALISLLGNWITIKSGLTPVLAPYIDYLLKLVGVA